MASAEAPLRYEISYREHIVRVIRLHMARLAISTKAELARLTERGTTYGTIKKSTLYDRLAGGSDFDTRELYVLSELFAIEPSAFFADPDEMVAAQNWKKNNGPHLHGLDGGRMSSPPRTPLVHIL